MGEIHHRRQSDFKTAHTHWQEQKRPWRELSPSEFFSRVVRTIKVYAIGALHLANSSEDTPPSILASRTISPEGQMNRHPHDLAHRRRQKPSSPHRND